MSRHSFLALRVAFAILPCVIASTPTLSSRHLATLTVPVMDTRCEPARCSSMIDMPTPLSSADLAVAYSPLSARRRPTGDAAVLTFGSSAPHLLCFALFAKFETTHICGGDAGIKL